MTLSDHIDVTDAGSVVMLRPMSAAAADWFLEHVGEPGPGGVYAVERRFVGPILEGAAADLLSWH